LGRRRSVRRGSKRKGKKNELAVLQRAAKKTFPTSVRGRKKKKRKGRTTVFHPADCSSSERKKKENALPIISGRKGRLVRPGKQLRMPGIERAKHHDFHYPMKGKEARGRAFSSVTSGWRKEGPGPPLTSDEPRGRKGPSFRRKKGRDVGRREKRKCTLSPPKKKGEEKSLFSDLEEEKKSDGRPDHRDSREVETLRRKEK